VTYFWAGYPTSLLQIFYRGVTEKPGKPREGGGIYTSPSLRGARNGIVETAKNYTHTQRKKNVRYPKERTTVPVFQIQNNSDKYTGDPER
jgi:hypothetical protein